MQESAGNGPPNAAMLAILVPAAQARLVRSATLYANLSYAMADDPNHPQNKANAAHQRLSAALRANLKRRKQQARGRSAENSTAPAGGSDAAPDHASKDRKEP